MKLTLLEKYGWIEAVLRTFSANHPNIKEIIKQFRFRTNSQVKTQAVSLNENAWAIYKNRIKDIVGCNSIVLIHSSMDGFQSIGVKAENFIDFFKELIADGNTVVIPTFPVTNLKPQTLKSRPYNPQKTLCWTGMLPNLFITEKGIVRSAAPFNSLAALGPKAEYMMANNLDATTVYGDHTAWKYCLEHHAKLLFVGVKASEANTMGIHMPPDVMGDAWPVRNWYQNVTYKIRIDNQIIERTIRTQQGFWYRYCMEERTSGRLKEAGILFEESVAGCTLAYIKDSQVMMNELIRLCKKGQLMYLIPRKYLKSAQSSIL